MKHALSYDTIYMTLPMRKSEAEAIIERIARDYPDEQRKRERHIMYKRMAFKASMWGLHVQNSLSRMLHGNNMIPLTQSECMDAIGELSDVTETALTEATVTRVDLCGDIELTRERCNDINDDDFMGSKFLASEYWYTLGSMTGYNRQDINGETITYYARENDRYNNERLQFEDKIKEMRDNRREIPTEAQGKNIVRIELSLYGRQRIEGVNGGKPVTASTLTDEVFFQTLCYRWYRMYKSIKHKSTRASLVYRPTTCEELSQGLASIGLAMCSNGYLESIIGEMEQSERNKCNRTLLPRLHRTSIIGTNEYREELTQGVEALYDGAVDRLRALYDFE